MTFRTEVQQKLKINIQKEWVQYHHPFLTYLKFPQTHIYYLNSAESAEFS